MTSYIYNMVDTWNDGATTFTAVKMNVTDTASNAASLLMDLQVGGSSRFKVDKNGNCVSAAGIFYGASNSSINIQGAYQNFTLNSGGLVFSLSNTNGVQVPNGYQFGFSSGIGAPDTILTRRAAANLRLGAADAAAPVAQTLSVQSVVAGTSNTAGTNLTITGSQGTGTGAGGSIVFQVAPAGSSGSAQNALADILTLQSANREATFTGWIRQTGTVTILGNSNFGTYNGVANLEVNQSIGFSAGAIVGNSPDVILRRDAANTLALRNGTAAQTFNIYNTYTSGSVYERVEAFWLSNSFTIRTAQSGGSARSMVIGTQGDANLIISTNTATRADFSSLGIKFYQNILLPTDNTYDIGAASADRPRNVFIGSYMQMTEMTAPAAPATNNVRIYAEDNGAGKTRLMALFPTGAAVQIAIEP